MCLIIIRLFIAIRKIKFQLLYMSRTTFIAALYLFCTKQTKHTTQSEEEGPVHPPAHSSEQQASD